ncbi:hypothetical protein PR1_127 [Providencia phage vB_PreS_PR1]|uniref:Uncharacterized protein n=1 Tax=Providencia phage vB_PreS_PR1 TaxID=1931407 RepID=A0A1S6KV22_9CAUD|nr:hypothetical protein FDH30_gp087 [Providencia phage vB_PreS_PR1]AQT25293.1 hypothetical protein PR1_127 [Providencia phage vB_PreS_PR1]
MLRFDYEKIYILSYGRSDLIIEYLRRLRDEPEACVSLLGSSFIVNSSVILDNPMKYNARILAEYVGLLSIRNYADYQLTGDTSLPMMSVYPWIPREIVESNPFVQISIDTLKFNKEEEKSYVRN